MANSKERRIGKGSDKSHQFYTYPEQRFSLAIHPPSQKWKKKRPCNKFVFSGDKAQCGAVNGSGTGSPTGNTNLASFIESQFNPSSSKANAIFFQISRELQTQCPCSS